MSNPHEWHIASDNANTSGPSSGKPERAAAQARLARNAMVRTMATA
jgi:hypothetical protein